MCAAGCQHAASEHPLRPELYRLRRARWALHLDSFPVNRWSHRPAVAMSMSTNECVRDIAHGQITGPQSHGVYFRAVTAADGAVGASPPENIHISRTSERPPRHSSSFGLLSIGLLRRIAPFRITERGQCAMPAYPRPLFPDHPWRPTSPLCSCRCSMLLPRGGPPSSCSSTPLYLVHLPRSQAMRLGSQKLGESGSVQSSSLQSSGC